MDVKAVTDEYDVSPLRYAQSIDVIVFVFYVISTNVSTSCMEASSLSVLSINISAYLDPIFPDTTCHIDLCFILKVSHLSSDPSTTTPTSRINKISDVYIVIILGNECNKFIQSDSGLS